MEGDPAIQVPLHRCTPAVCIDQFINDITWQYCGQIH